MPLSPRIHPKAQRNRRQTGNSVITAFYPELRHRADRFHRWRNTGHRQPPRPRPLDARHHEQLRREDDEGGEAPFYPASLLTDVLRCGNHAQTTNLIAVYGRRQNALAHFGGARRRRSYRRFAAGTRSMDIGDGENHERGNAPGNSCLDIARRKFSAALFAKAADAAITDIWSRGKTAVVC